MKHKNLTSLMRSQWLVGLRFIIIVALVAGFGAHFLFKSHADSPTAPATPAATDAEICGDTGILNGPSTAPNGAVTVAAGDDSSATLNTPNTVYWFAPGTHTLGTSQYGQIDPGTNDTYEGAPGAILSGQGDNEYAFVANYQAPYDTGVTIEYLTIQDFVPPGSAAAVNENGGPGWTIQDDTIQNNIPGAAMMLGTDSTVQDNCLTENGQYAFNGYTTLDTSTLTGGPSNITLSHNEISYNDTCNWEVTSNFPITSPSGCSGAGQFDGCGCGGGGKFWETQNVIVTDNYVHDNYDVGLWADTNNDGITFEGNYISDSYGSGIQYEVSYNALIEDNTFLENGLGEGEADIGFPVGAIYLSESGGDSRVTNSAGIDTITVSNNIFTNNWDGVVAWENSNRFCSNGLPTSQCTLVSPSVYTSDGDANNGAGGTCGSGLANSSENQPTDNPDYFDNCRWKTQNVLVNNNTFNLNPSTIGSDCTTAKFCGLNALFSVYGSTAPYTSAIVPVNITFNQGNSFSDNIYNGPWQFMAWAQSNEDYPITKAEWTAAVTDKCDTTEEVDSGTCDSGFGQDAGSTFNSTYNGVPAPTTPTNVTATANSSTSVTVSWSASTDSGGPGLSGYYILRGGTQVASVGSSATSYTDTVSANTAYNYTVEAFDTADPPNVSNASTTATVTTPASSGSSSPPSVSISTLTNGAEVHSTTQAIDAVVTPASGNTISNVKLLVNGTTTQTLTTAPYNFTLNPLNYTDNTYTIEIEATDNHNNVGSQSLTLTIVNGDLNGDGEVNISDLILLAQNYGKSGTFSYNQGNITGATTSPEVGLPDLLKLATNYGYGTH